MNNISSLLFILPALLWSIAAYQMSAAKAAHWSHLWWTVCLPQDLCQCCNQGFWTLFFPTTVLGDFCLFIFEVPVIVILNLQKYWTAAWSSDMVLFCFFLTELYKFVIANSLWILVLPRHGLSVWVPEMISPAVSS